MKNENMTALEEKFGSVEFEGKKYILTDQADHTNRLLHYNGYNDPDDDGNYDFEMSALAIDGQGNYEKVDRVSEN